MEFKVTLRIDAYNMGEAQAKNKSYIINDFFRQINDHIKNNDYGNEILEYLVSLYVVNPPNGYEHLHKDFKPKYTEYKLLTNIYTGQKMEIKKHFHYSVKITGQRYKEFVIADETESKKILSQEILNSLSNLDALPKKVKNFNKERFISDMEQFFKSEELM